MNLIALRPPHTGLEAKAVCFEQIMKRTIACLLLALSACKPLPAQEAAKENEHDSKPEMAEAVVSVAALKSETLAQAVEGTATVLAPDTLIQIDADLRAQKIAADFSKAQRARSETLFKDKVTISRQDMETAARQSETDAVQLSLLENRFRMTWGETAPFLDAERRRDVVARLSSGQLNIARLDFPNIDTHEPRNVKVMPLSGTASVAIDTLWPAPQGNLAMPGSSFFALLPAAPGLRQGDRARAVADNGDSATGVVIPSSAIVITEGRAWAFVQKHADKYARRPVSLENPVEGGYLVKLGFAEGDKVVVRGAGHLLAREAEPEEEDDK